MTVKSKSADKLQTGLSAPANEIWAHHQETLKLVQALNGLFSNIRHISILKNSPQQVYQRTVKALLASIKELGFSDAKLLDNKHIGVLRLAFTASRLDYAARVKVDPIVQIGGELSATSFHELSWLFARATQFQLLQELETLNCDELENRYKTDSSQLLERLSQVQGDADNESFLPISNFRTFRWRELLTYEVAICLASYGKGSAKLTEDKSPVAMGEREQRSKFAYQLSLNAQSTWIEIQDKCNNEFPNLRPWTSERGSSAEKSAKAYWKVDTRLEPIHSPSIRQALELYLQDGQVTELRALNCKVEGECRTGTYSGYFDREHIDDLIIACERIVFASGIYFIPNPVNPAILARAYNRARLIHRDGQVTSDMDIDWRRWLLFDVAPVHPSNVSATDEEKLKAKEVLTDIDHELWRRGFPPGIIVDSGNGWNLSIPIDFRVDDRGNIARLLKSLARDFDFPHAQLDTSAYNPARILKLPGTMSCEGDNCPELGREWRMACINSICSEVPNDA